MARAKSKAEKNGQTEWSAHCAYLLRDRARWLDDYEHTMLNDNAEGDWEPTDAQKAFTERIAYETEEVSHFENYSVQELLRMAHACVAELPLEEEEDIVALSEDGCSRVSRRKARRLLAIARRWAI